MRRLFWFGLGAAAGYYGARRGEQLVARARERGLVGNVTLVATNATKAASVATRTAYALGERARALVADPDPTPETPSDAPYPRPFPAETTREARP